MSVIVTFMMVIMLSPIVLLQN